MNSITFKLHHEQLQWGCSDQHQPVQFDIRHERAKRWLHHPGRRGSHPCAGAVVEGVDVGGQGQGA